MTEPQLTAAEQYMRDLWISEQWKLVREYSNADMGVRTPKPGKRLANPERRIELGIDNGESDRHTGR